MKRRVAKTGAAALALLLAWLVWQRLDGTTAPASSPTEPGSPPSAPPPSLSPAPHPVRSATPPPVPVPPPNGIVDCEIHVTTFGDPPVDVLIQQVLGRDGIGPALGRVRVPAKPGQRVSLQLSGVAVFSVSVQVPDPVPPHLEVRVPSRDDPRLADPVLLVVDEVSGKPLPNALLDPGARAPEELPIRADAEGRIRVPRAMAERIRAYASILQGGVVSERDHVPRAFSSLAEMDQATLADWAQWDATGAMRVTLEPFPTDHPVPRRRLRIVDEDGVPRKGRLVMMRTPAMEMLLLPPLPARTDAGGVAEVVAPAVASYDVYDGACLVGTFVLAQDAMPEHGTREIRVPKPVRVHVVVRGLAAPRPNVWIHGPDVVSLEPDDRTGWARLDGVVQPGWKAFGRAELTVVQVSEGLPAEMDILVPRDRPIALEVAGREAVLRADESKTIELDWTTLPAPAKAPGNFAWSFTREGLDQLPGAGPSTSKEKEPGK